MAFHQMDGPTGPPTMHGNLTASSIRFFHNSRDLSSENLYARSAKYRHAKDQAARLKNTDFEGVLQEARRDRVLAESEAKAGTGGKAGAAAAAALNAARLHFAEALHDAVELRDYDRYDKYNAASSAVHLQDGLDAMERCVRTPEAEEVQECQWQWCRLAVLRRNVSARAGAAPAAVAAQSRGLPPALRLAADAAPGDADRALACGMELKRACDVPWYKRKADELLHSAEDAPKDLDGATEYLWRAHAMEPSPRTAIHLAELAHAKGDKELQKEWLVQCSGMKPVDTLEASCVSECRVLARAMGADLKGPWLLKGVMPEDGSRRR